MCASERCFGWERKPCSGLYLKRLPELAKANTYRCPIMSIELGSGSIIRAWHCRRFTIVMEASETSAAAVSVSAFRGEDAIVEGSGVSLDLTDEGRR